MPLDAVAIAIARLPTLSTAEAIESLQRVDDQDVRTKAIERLASVPEKGLFESSYMSGGLALHGLLQIVG